VLTRTFPPELVDRVIAKTGRAEQRQRLLPARVVVYYTLAMCLFTQAGYEEVMRLLVEGLAWLRRWRGSWQIPDKSSIARARARLGPAPLRELFVEVARPLATRKTKGAWYRGWRLVALDGTTLDVPDTPANVAAFGRPGGGRGQGAFPQVRLVGLVECGTHAVVDAAMGGLHLGEGSLAPSLARSLGPGMLLLVDQAWAGWSCGAPSRRRGRSWYGAAVRTSSWRCWRSWRMAPGAASWARASPGTSGWRCGSWTTGWTILAALASRRAIGSSPRSWTRARPGGRAAGAVSAAVGAGDRAG
jgi:Insertion element 4 transposase N-terminal